MSSREFPQVELEVGGYRFAALLPMPLVETAEVVYYFVVIDSVFRQFVSAQFTSRVTAAAVAGSVSGGTPVLKLKPVRPGSAAQLRGFRPDGVVGVPTSNTSAQAATPAPSPTPASRSAASKERAAGSGGRGLLLGVVGGAAAGLLGVMALKGEPEPTPTPGPRPTPTVPPPPITLKPEPVPTPTPTPSPFDKYYGTYRIRLTTNFQNCDPRDESIVLSGGKAGGWFEMYQASKPGLACSGSIQKNGQFNCSTPTGVTVSGSSDGGGIHGDWRDSVMKCLWAFNGQKVAQ